MRISLSQGSPKRRLRRLRRQHRNRHRRMTLRGAISVQLPNAPMVHTRTTNPARAPVLIMAAFANGWMNASNRRA
jgi:hypothetical protein